jgi:2-hydroxy-3-oxopropionate reductase
MPLQNLRKLKVNNHMHHYEIGVIGLGAIGEPVARNLSSKFRIQVWNRNPQKYLNLDSQTVSIAESLGSFDAAVILTVLPNCDEVLEVLNTGLLETLEKDDLLVVMGTVSPESMSTINDLVGTKGARAVDAPVSGGDVGAQEARLSIMVGGSSHDYTRLLPFFKVIGSSIKHVGALGSAQGLKACNQILVGGNLVAIAEALSLSRKFKISDQDFFDVISNGLAGSSALSTKWPKLSSGNFSDGGKSSFQLKDLLIALQAANGAGLNLPMTQLLSDLYQEHIENGNSDLDHSSIIKIYESDIE